MAIVRWEPFRDLVGLQDRMNRLFDESFRGTSRRVHLFRFEHCEGCGGSGEVAYGPVPCPRCKGTGQVRGSRGHMIFSRRCGDCDGSGRLQRRGCTRCTCWPARSSS